MELCAANDSMVQRTFLLGGYSLVLYHREILTVEICMSSKWLREVRI